MAYFIEKCKTCTGYDPVNMRHRNGLMCTFGCEEQKQYASQKAIEWNRAVSGENFDNTELFEHGKKVYGSGRKGEKV